MATATQVLNEARSQVGYREGARNYNKYGLWYGWNNVAYCAIGLTWCAARVPGGLAAIGGRWAYCPSWANWFRSKGRMHQTGQRGDIVFFDWSGKKRRGYEAHVGIVESISGSYVLTVEFNTAAGYGNQSDGGGVHKRTRHISTVVGFGRPFYAGEIAVTPIKTVPVAYTHSGISPLVVDGAWGAATTRRLQILLGVQIRDGQMGPVTFNALARWLGQKQVGGWSTAIKTALQYRVGVAQDAVIGPQTVKALQRYLNRNVH
jgi:hypothetical protein